MKYAFLIFELFFFNISIAKNSNNQNIVKNTILTFFDGFLQRKQHINYLK